MDMLDENLEQLDFFESSSQGEEVSQCGFGAEEEGIKLGSKDDEEQKFSSTNEGEIVCEKKNNTLPETEESGRDSKQKNLEEESFSKFKSVEELEKAYKNLQSDYTRKCQALAVLQKEKEAGEKSSKTANARAWQEKVNEFLVRHEEAKEFLGEIEKLACEDERFSQSASPLDEAWNFFKVKNFVSPSRLAGDEEFLKNYIYTNSKIREKIVKDYISSVKTSFSPTLISGKNGAKTLLTPKSRPKTVSEATKLVEDMFSF